jgi:hypothetical protein
MLNGWSTTPVDTGISVDTGYRPAERPRLAAATVKHHVPPLGHSIMVSDREIARECLTQTAAEAGQRPGAP